MPAILKIGIAHYWNHLAVASVVIIVMNGLLYNKAIDERTGIYKDNLTMYAKMKMMNGKRYNNGS